MPSPGPELHSSASFYTRRTLCLYDLVVLRFSNAFAWQCSTGAVLLPFFQQYLGVHSHLDVGVGSAYYPARSAALLTRNATKLTLMDLNPSTLQQGVARIRAAGFQGDIELVAHDVFEPAPDELQNKPFEAVSLFYVFHCLPGRISDKASRIFERLIPLMRSDGTVYGATILGKGIRHKWVGRGLMKLWNSKGVFDNYEDDVEGLTDALREYFEDVKVRVEGKVALFVGRRPLRPHSTPDNVDL